MSPNLRIALRFLTARKRSMFMSLLGIVFGVGFFIVTQAQTSGFEQFFIKTILGTNGAIRIQDRFQPTLFTMQGKTEDGQGKFSVDTGGSRKYVEGVEDPALVSAAIRGFSNVSGVSTVVQGIVTLTTDVGTADARVYGINLDDHLAVSDLGSQIIRGSLGDYREAPGGSLVGSVLALHQNLRVGDSYMLQVGGQSRRYRVSAIYETGVSDIDRVRIYLHLSEARSLLQKPIGASFLQVNLFDRDRAAEDSERMQAVIGHAVSPWQRREKTWLAVFSALRFSSAITVSTIILISGLGMFNTLAMLVIEKTKDIAILRSMGYTRRDIARIFLWQGVLVLIGGVLLGWLFGALATYGVSKVPIRIRGIFTTDSFVVAWAWEHYAVAALTASVVVLAASWIPARRAARLEPGDVVRGTAQ
ncbi:ABC transporter permease [Rariglobus hedericola]|uniref:ABC transporter permease n=2 Tax=Rariglobus hedericola TaxID=2597822 RepID=A0A556QLK8_9BACT|nr:ABC transporter permease [Rariglobus hedericola]